MLRSESRIVEVVVHARGARVVRAVELGAAPGASRATVVVAGVGLSAVPGSFRARVRGDRRLRTIASRVVHARETPTLADLERRRRAITEARRAVQLELEAVGRHGARLAAAALRPGFTPRGHAPDAADRIRTSLAVAAWLDAELAAAHARELALGRRLAELAREDEALDRREDEAGADDRRARGTPTREVVLELDGDGAIEGIELEYQVRAARWWPLYTLQLTGGGAEARWLVEALVSQGTDEDWRGVKLSLSTADLAVDASLPELPALRLGRATPQAHRPPRPPPDGLTRLFVAYDAARATLTEHLVGASFGGVALDARDDEDVSDDLIPSDEEAEATASGVARERAMGFGEGAEALASVDRAMPMRGGVTPPPRAPPALAASPAPMMARAIMGGGGEPMKKRAAHGRARRVVLDQRVEIDERWLDYDALELAGPDDAARGRLVPRVDDGQDDQLDADTLPPGVDDVVDPLDGRGQFDHRWDAAGMHDVPADARARRVVVATARAPTTLRYRTVPRERDEVYRTLTVTSPFEAPLLAGPADVYVDGSLLTTTRVPATDRGGRVTLGLGVENRLRVARNVRVVEDSAGLLGGSLSVEHQVTIELRSSLGSPAEIEVIDRAPVTDDKSLEVRALRAEPPAEAISTAQALETSGLPPRGGLRWRVVLTPGGRHTIAHGYALKLSKNLEVVGGNRRD
jgi:hypothetical protein